MTGETRRFSPRLFYATMAAGSIGTARTAPITALSAIALGASEAQAALIVSATAVSFLVVDLAGSRVVPRVVARSVLVGGYLVFGAGSFLSAMFSAAPGDRAAAVPLRRRGGGRRAHEGVDHHPSRP